MNAKLKTPALLKRAADVIDQRGWYQDDYINEAGCVCVLGAFRVAVAEAAGVEEADIPNAVLGIGGLLNWDLINEVDDAASALHQHIDEPAAFFGVAEWNDHPGRTKDEVTAALRAAAEAGESK